MSLFVPISGPIIANTFYCNNKQAARDVGMTMPEVAPTMVDVQAMGTLSLPIWQLLDHMELSITKIGFDDGFGEMIVPEPMNLEARFVQTMTDANGKTSEVGCKAFFRGTTSVIPGADMSIGEVLENGLTYSITRYQLMVNGKEKFLIDRLATILRINGKDYAANMRSLL